MSKNGTRMPFWPSITSRTGGVSDPITKHPVLMASIIYHERTKG